MTSATPYQCIPGSAGQVWALDIVDGTLFCCHDLGLYEVNAATIKPVEGVKGIWHCVPADLSGEALLATYAGYYKLQRGASGWTVSGKLKGYDASASAMSPNTNRRKWQVCW